MSEDLPASPGNYRDHLAQWKAPAHPTAKVRPYGRSGRPFSWMRCGGHSKVPCLQELRCSPQTRRCHQAKLKSDGREYIHNDLFTHFAFRVSIFLGTCRGRAGCNVPVPFWRANIYGFHCSVRNIFCPHYLITLLRVTVISTSHLSCRHLNGSGPIDDLLLKNWRNFCGPDR